jgi:hypothetical protein
MKIRELLSESLVRNNQIISEGLMGGKDWKNETGKYLIPFIEGINNRVTYAFNIGYKPANKKKGSESQSGRNFLGKIKDPQTVTKLIRRAERTDDWSGIVFDVDVVDDENPDQLTNEVVKNVRLGNIYKDEKIKGEIKPNMGNVSEALLGCAVAAKFYKEGGIVTEKDLADMGRQLAQNNGVIQIQAGKDTLIFKVSIPFLDKKIFYAWLGEGKRTLEDYRVPQKSIDLIERRVKASVDYANTSKRVSSAIAEAINDPRNNKIDVISDGGEKENQSTTKVDLRILIDGQPTAKRLLSIKAGDVAQAGQVTGVNFEHANEFFSTTVGLHLPQTLRKYFNHIEKGSRNVEDEKIYNFENGYYRAFDFVFKQLKSRAKTDQANLVEDIYRGILHHLTRNEEGVEMVILDPDDKKAFRELSFGSDFEQALRQLQIVVTESNRALGYNISIYGFPVGSIAKKYIPSRRDADSKLIDLTSQFKDGSIRNMLAMGSLLKHIADIETYIEQQSEEEPEQPAPKKVNAAVPANPVQKQLPPAANTQPQKFTNKAPVGSTPPQKIGNKVPMGSISSQGP